MEPSMNCGNMVIKIWRQDVDADFTKMEYIRNKLEIMAQDRELYEDFVSDTYPDKSLT
jgi:hypothetical protein